MAVISITVVQSAEQVISGIPKTVSITANIPSTIFYTLDGSTPTLFSTIYTGPIFLPYDQLLVNLNILATNGTDSSPIITECFQTDMVSGNVRLPHSSTNAQPGSNIPNTYPFGTPPFEPNQQFLNPALAGVNVYDPALPATPTSFNADGYGAGYTNQSYNSLNYQIIYNQTNAEGEQTYGVGDLPGLVSYQWPAPDPEQTTQFTATFNPRAFVIFQDFSKEDPNDPPQINRQYFSLEDPEKTRDGSYFFQSGGEAPPPSGSFVRAHYNERTGEITHYYRDSWSNRWIISTAPYQPNVNVANNLSASVIGRSSKVFEWIPGFHRTLI